MKFLNSLELPEEEEVADSVEVVAVEVVDIVEGVAGTVPWEGKFLPNGGVTGTDHRHLDMVAVGNRRNRDTVLPSLGDGLLNGHAASRKSKTISCIYQHCAGTLVFNDRLCISNHSPCL